MSNTRYFAGNKGRFIFCDICGQACYAWEATKLDNYTGRGGLIVCPRDVDAVNPGFIPFTVPVEKIVPWTRINHTNTDNAVAPLDYEAATTIGT